ncbi:MAG TPA: ATP-binding protein [Fimbriiglobus sp.]|jgi:signal transduction histidine kinase
MFWRLSLAYTLLLLAAVGMLDLIVLGRVERVNVERVEADLRVKAMLVKEMVRGVDPRTLQSRVAALRTDTGMRVTLLADDGIVLADTDEEPHQMENHALRPEVLQARSEGFGSSIRRSTTVHQTLMYVALRTQDLRDIAFVRVAVPLEDVRHQLAGLRTVTGSAALLTGIAATALAFWVARRFTKSLHELAAATERIAAGEFGRTVATRDSGEVGTLARAFNQMSVQLAAQFSRLEDDRLQLKRLESIRQEFVANASHELKTPLAVIQVAVETLQDGAVDDPDTRATFLSQIAEQGHRLHALVIDLLSLARIESGQTTLEFQPVPVGAAVVACVDRHRARAEAKGISLEAIPPASGSDPAAWADEESIEQILDNLVDNAVKYTPAGGRVRVTWRIDGSNARIAVEDTGIGIPATDLERVFERFYRVDRARSREMGGTGLGLSIVKHLVQAMHGGIHAESQPGRGSVFTVHLPRPADARTSPVLHKNREAMP